VQFSTDGKLLITHSNFPYANFIAVFNTSSGIILSARIYSEGGNSNYNDQVKSMIISSGASPMAYVLSNYFTETFIGQHLFKFNPLS
jgi:hypothetical protein